MHEILTHKIVKTLLSLLKHNKLIMEHTFSGIVDKVYKLPLEDRQQLLDLLENNIAEERRNDIYKNYLSALNEEKEGDLKFSSDISHLKQMM